MQLGNARFATPDSMEINIGQEKFIQNAHLRKKKLVKVCSSYLELDRVEMVVQLIQLLPGEVSL